MLNWDYHGLEEAVFKVPFENIEDAFLREKALWSLSWAGPDQASLYDFSFR